MHDPNDRNHPLRVPSSTATASSRSTYPTTRSWSHPSTPTTSRRRCRDPVAATRAALDAPLGSGPIGDLVRRGSTVTIAFPDRVKGGAHEHRAPPGGAATAARRALAAAGVRPEDVRLVCAIGLHRKNHRHEFEDYLGERRSHRVPAQNVVNHDAEDPDGIADLGLSELGDAVQVNSAVVESDLTVLVGHAAGNPCGGFSGGYKMPRHRPHHVALDRLAPHAALALPRRLRAGVRAPLHFRDQLTSIGVSDGAADAAALLLRRRRARLALAPARVHAGAIADVERRPGRSRPRAPTCRCRASPPTCWSSACRGSSTTGAAWAPTRCCSPRRSAPR